MSIPKKRKARSKFVKSWSMYIPAAIMSENPIFKKMILNRLSHMSKNVFFIVNSIIISFIPISCLIVSAFKTLSKLCFDAKKALHSLKRAFILSILCQEKILDVLFEKVAKASTTNQTQDPFRVAYPGS